jgi:hypothetical protein
MAVAKVQTHAAEPNCVACCPDENSLLHLTIAAGSDSKGGIQEVTACFLPK